MTERPDTRDERLLDLYRRAPRPEPPARLDAAIRAAAHEAVGRRRRLWAWPALATAAVLVLAVGLVLRHPDLADRPEAGPTWESELRDAPRASPAMPAYRSEDYAPRVQESVPTAPAERVPAAAREATVATDPLASRADIVECPPLPPELTSDPARLRQRAAELLEAGQTDEAHCLLRQVEADAGSVPSGNTEPTAPAGPPAGRDPSAR